MRPGSACGRSATWSGALAATPQRETVRLLARRAGPDRPGTGPVRDGRPGPSPGERARGRRRGGDAVAAAGRGLVHRPAAGTRAAGQVRADRGRGGQHPRDRRDGRGRQDRVRGARRAPAGGPVPRRADLPAAARAHARPGRRSTRPTRWPACCWPSGCPPAQVPPGLEARAALWRDRVADRPLLLVLDDAAGSEQVRPLLPGAGGSLVLVTSRRHLSALDDATAISLDTLPPDDAAALLVRLAGRAGLSPGDPGGPGDHRAVRVPAAGGRDGGPPAAPSPGLDGGGAGGGAGGGPGPAGADGDREPVGGGRVRPVLRRPRPPTSSGCSAGSGCTRAPTSTPTPPPPWTAPACPRPAAAWRPCTTSTC